MRTSPALLLGRTARRYTWTVARWLALALMLVHGMAAALSDPPGRVGRLAALQGGVQVFDHEQGQWATAERNRPLTSGDRVSTGSDGRAELRVGSTVLRLAGGSELEVLRLDDERLEFQLHAGSLALRVRSRSVAPEITLVTAEARLQPLRSGRYRIDRLDDTSQATSLLGELRIDDEQGFVIDTGRRVELWREGPQSTLRHAWNTPADDEFAQWVARADRDDERSAAARHVSPEMTGVEELDRHGRWDRHPEYGSVWVPAVVAPGWAPYRVGRWAWMRPWGWTWVDDAPWGFAPFHYGRWLYWGQRWAWAPGVYVPRPIYAPALVAWMGGPRVGWSVSIGSMPYPAIGWVPLAPREVYVPYYPISPGYFQHINPPVRPLPPGQSRPPVQVPQGPVVYGNQGAPGAVTVVPREVLVNRRPVALAAASARVDDDGDWQRAPVAAGGTPPAPPPPPERNITPVATGLPVASGAADGRPSSKPRRDQPPTGEAIQPATAAAPAMQPLAEARPPRAAQVPKAERPPRPPREAKGDRDPKPGRNNGPARERTELR